VPRRFAGVAELAAVTRAALGARPALASADRLRGGSKKGVYRLTFDDQSTVIAYVWAPEENFWAARDADAGPFSEASGATAGRRLPRP
jgi:hypothetical protein